MTKKILTFLACFWPFILFGQVGTPKLIVQIIIDQLRGDLLGQYRDKFKEGGFNYLYNHGLDYHNAHHPHANTVTCVGHATIASGAYPAMHGIISNQWYNRLTHQHTKCVEDSNSPILKTFRSQKALSGRSPVYLMTSTLSDEIVLAQKGRAFAISFKDRGAIPLAGHAGKAFWFDKENGGFITSQYYYSKYPNWVNNWNQNYVTKNEIWNLSAVKEHYLYATAPMFEHRFPAFGKTFPHHLGLPDSASYYKFLSMTPFADELTADFSLALLKHEKLGENPNKTDYLAISFSGMDAIGHQFGPNSLESEDNLLRLDKTLAKLLVAIDKQVGLNNTLIVLTGDHGVSDSTAFLSQHHLVKIGAPSSLPNFEKIVLDILVNDLKLPATTLEAVSLPYIYLNHEVIWKKKRSLKKISHYVAERLSQQPGIFQAYPMPLNKEKPNWLSEKVNKMICPLRSGDIYLVPPPYQTLGKRDSLRVSHGTPWQYDSYVPLIFTNPAFKSQRFIKFVEITTIAPTLSAILSIKSPSAAVNSPLKEVIKNFYDRDLG